MRIAYSLFTNNPGRELDDFERWDAITAFGDGDDRLKVNGIGEVIVYSAYDFENFVQPRPEISDQGLGTCAKPSGGSCSIAGPSGCMRPTTKRSASISISSRRSIVNLPSAACTGSLPLRNDQ